MNDTAMSVSLEQTQDDGLECEDTFKILLNGSIQSAS